MSSYEDMAVADSIPVEDHLLPEPVETFLFMALCWCLVVWLLRLCYMAIHVLELQAAIRTGRLSLHEDVPLHAHVATTDPQTRTRFLSFLRMRTPPTPTAAVPCYSIPLSLNGVTQRRQESAESRYDHFRGRLATPRAAPSSPSPSQSIPQPTTRRSAPHPLSPPVWQATMHVVSDELRRLEVTFSLACSGTMQLYWGVAPEAATQIVDQSAVPPRRGDSGSSRGASALARGASRWMSGPAADVDATQIVPQCATPRSGVATNASAVAPSPDPIRAGDVEAAPLPAANSSADHPANDDVVLAGHAQPQARGTIGGRLSELGGRLSSARTTSPVVRQLSAVQLAASHTGIEMRTTAEIRAGRGAPCVAGQLMGGATAAGDGPSHTLPPACFSMASPPRRVSEGTQITEVFGPAELPGDLSVARLPLLLVISNFQRTAAASPSRREAKGTAATSSGSGDADGGANASAGEGGGPAVPAALATAAEQPVGCCMVHLSFNFADEAQPPAPAPAAAADAPASEADAAEGSDSALVPADAQPSLSADDAPSSPPEDPTSPVSPSTVGVDVAPAQPSVAPTPNPPEVEPKSFSTSAVLGKAMARTPHAVMQLHDIFGLSDWSSAPECVACLTEPKDTILLPCRHLCVCHHCFDHLTLDTCPVCRAPFQSYLRFDVDQNDVCDGVGDDDDDGPDTTSAGEP